MRSVAHCSNSTSASYLASQKYLAGCFNWLQSNPPIPKKPSKDFQSFVSTILPKILRIYSLLSWITSALISVMSVSDLTSDRGIRSLFLQRCMQYQRFAALLRLSVKYEMAGVHKILVHRVQRYYPVEMSDYECVMEEHGTAAAAAFTSFPHPNQILKLFWECEIRQCLPIAFYEATVRGVNSLTSPKPKVFLPRQISTPALKALAAFNNGYREHVGSVLYSFCSDCRCKNLLAIEQWLHPVRGDLSLFPLRDVGVKPGVSGLLCESCVGEMVDAYSAWRLSIWADLPGTFGLPGWRELSKLVVLK